MHRLSTPLRLVVDENIPYAREAFGGLGTVRLRPGRTITASALRAAEVLLVRSVTRVDAALLEGSPVRFVGSATIGTDHVDLAYLKDRAITFAHAPGSNAGSVVEYVLAALTSLAVHQGTTLRGKTIAVIGCGNIGGRLAACLPALGLKVLQVDPPLAAQAERDGVPHAYQALDEVLPDADLVTIHVPLLHEGTHPTYHLFDEERLGWMKPGSWLLNTARGAVVRNTALKRSLADGRLGAAVLDVWEGEPRLDEALLPYVALATPHIAGYSFDGKVQGTLMVYQALMDYLGMTATWQAAEALAPGPSDILALTPPDPALDETAWLDGLVRQMYDLRADDARLRRVLTLPSEEARAAYFGDLRRRYPRRRRFTLHTLQQAAVPLSYREAVRHGLGVQWQ